MSPAFVNSNDHAIRVQDEDGALQRIIPQQVIDADGAYADRLSRTAGVEEADDDDRSTWESMANTAVPDSLYRRDQVRQASLARVNARRVSVVGPLQRVVGDDSAPYAPPTGTITTKQAVVEGLEPGDPQRIAYADHEAVQPVEGVDAADVLDPTATPIEPEVHNAQHEAFVAAGEAAELLEADTGDGGNGSDDGLGGEDTLQPPYDGANKAQLQAEASRRNLSVEGTGVGGTVSKSDLVDALNDDDAQGSGATT